MRPQSRRQRKYVVLPIASVSFQGSLTSVLSNDRQPTNPMKSRLPPGSSQAAEDCGAQNPNHSKSILKGTCASPARLPLRTLETPKNATTPPGMLGALSGRIRLTENHAFAGPGPLPPHVDFKKAIDAVYPPERSCEFMPA